MRSPQQEAEVEQMGAFSTITKGGKIPRLPLEGALDLTYRCNNNCRHCWLRISPNSTTACKELTVKEIKSIIDDARSMGCQKWFISGGEPLLRPDFTEIFDYLTKKSVNYSLNTNGTLITPKIAQLMKRKGSKMISLYGATPDVHDHITQNPGSFKSAMRGFAYLKEAEVGFIVQLIPMKDNYHQLQDMILLAESLSPHWRIGASWLYLSACNDPKKNKLIKNQRLPPKIIVELDLPDIPFEESINEKKDCKLPEMRIDDHLFVACISSRRSFHIDPYGNMSFCSFIKDQSLRYDLKKGSFQEGWEKFIPSLSDKVKGGKEYLNNCGKCELQSDCRWCAVYGYLEHRRFSARVEYLCAIAKKMRDYKTKWRKYHRRYYKIAGITLEVDSRLPIKNTTFLRKFKFFEIQKPGVDKVSISHRFFLPDLHRRNMWKEIFRKPPWAIYQNRNSWIYLEISKDDEAESINRVGIFNHDHTKLTINNPDGEDFSNGNLHSLTLFPNDQVFLAQILAHRDGCYINACGVILEKKGYLFIVNKEYIGKSNTVNMLRNCGKILSDDWIIVRKHSEGLRIHGTWHYCETPDVSNSSAPLEAIFFLENNKTNQFIPYNDKKKVIKKLQPFLMEPLNAVNVRDKIQDLVQRIVTEVSCFSLQFDRPNKIVDFIKEI